MLKSVPLFFAACTWNLNCKDANATTRRVATWCGALVCAVDRSKSLQPPRSRLRPAWASASQSVRLWLSWSQNRASGTQAARPNRMDDVLFISLLDCPQPACCQSGGSSTKSFKRSSRAHSIPLPATMALAAPFMTFHLWWLDFTWPSRIPISCPNGPPSTLLALCSGVLPASCSTSEASLMFWWLTWRLLTSSSAKRLLATCKSEHDAAVLVAAASRCWMLANKSLQTPNWSAPRPQRDTRFESREAVGVYCSTGDA